MRRVQRALPAVIREETNRADAHRDKAICVESTRMDDAAGQDRSDAKRKPRRHGGDPKRGKCRARDDKPAGLGGAARCPVARGRWSAPREGA